METKNIQSIQNLINKKARQRLDSDIDALNRTVRSGALRNLLGNTEVTIKLDNKDVTVALCDIFLQSNIRNAIFNNNVERYIKEESEDFLEKVESLREDVDNLLENVQN